MHPQLLPIRKELDACSDRVSRLADWAGDEFWGMRPAADSWSASECVRHLNETSRAMLPLINEQLRESRRVEPPPKYGFSMMGWIIWWSTSPPVRTKFKTTAPFVPAGASARKDDLVAWAVCQSDVLGTLERSDGHPLSNLRVASPFDARVKYNVYSAFRIIAAHQRRHLDQAEKAIEVVRNR